MEYRQNDTNRSSTILICSTCISSIVKTETSNTIFMGSIEECIARISGNLAHLLDYRSCIAIHKNVGQSNEETYESEFKEFGTTKSINADNLV